MNKFGNVDNPTGFDTLLYYLIDLSTLKDIEDNIRNGYNLAGVDYDPDREYKLGITLTKD
jgi:hypothetical protein